MARLARALVALVVVVGCGGAPPGEGTAASSRIDLATGPIERARLEAELPTWRNEMAQAEIDEAAAGELGTVAPGAHVEVFLGTWCGDSRRVISRLFVALDQLGATPPPFTMALIAVDHDKRDPGGLTDGRDIRYVPTIIVSRDGAEVGRIVESAPNGVEVDLLRLLRGEARGTISLRTDL